MTSTGLATFLAPPPSNPAQPPAPPTTSQLLGPHNLNSFAQNPAPKGPFVSLSASLDRSSEVVCYRPWTPAPPPRTAPFPSPSSTSPDPPSRAPREINLRLSPPTPLLRYYILTRSQPRRNPNLAPQARCRLQSAISPNPEPRRLRAWIYEVPARARPCSRSPKFRFYRAPISNPSA